MLDFCCFSCYYISVFLAIIFGLVCFDLVFVYWWSLICLLVDRVGWYISVMPNEWSSSNIPNYKCGDSDLVNCELRWSSHAGIGSPMCGVLFHFSVRLSFLYQDATPWLLALSMEFCEVSVWCWSEAICRSELSLRYCLPIIVCGRLVVVSAL